MRQSRPSSGDVTQTAPPPTAMPESPVLIGIPSATRFVAGSIRVTLLSVQLRNHTPSAPAASVLTCVWTGIFATIRALRGSMR